LRVLLAVLLCLSGGALVSGPWWGPMALSRFDYFHVRRIEFEGLRYARAADLVATLRVDTTQSVWQALGPLARRVAANPIVASAEIERRLPGTLVVRLSERIPVALAPKGGKLKPMDATGQVLPIDPARVPLDLPVAASSDTTLLRVLDVLRAHAPVLYARVTDARRASVDELQFTLGALRVRTGNDVTVARFRDILPVEADLARNHLRAVELDLRFRDQVIARQP
jgi:cell division protein FtsQ